MRAGMAIALVMLVAGAATAQPEAPTGLSLTAEPATGQAPLEVRLAAGSSQPANVTWWMFIPAGDTVVKVANGSSLPANATLVFQEPGTYEVRIVANHTDGPSAATAVVTVAAPLAAGAAAAPLVGGDVLPLAFAGVLMLSLAGWLYARDRHNRLNVAFALLFTARGLADLTNGLLANRGVGRLQLSDAVMDRLHPTVSIAVVAAAAYFLMVYLAQNNARMARLRPGRWTAGTGISFVVLAWAWPALYWGTPDAQGGILFAFTGLHYPLYTTIVYLLVLESRKPIPDDRRSGAFSSAVGFLFLPVFVGAGEFLFVDALGFFRALETGTGIGFALGHWAAVLSLIPLLMAAAVLLRASYAEPERRHTRLHLMVFAGAMALALASLVLPLAAYGGSGDVRERSVAVARLFWIFQGIWAIPYAVLVAWGLTRYQASSQQSDMRRQLRRFGLATFFFTIFFAVSEGLEALASGRLGQEIGLATAAGLTLVLGPVQERLQKRFIGTAPEAETSQEVRFYTEQLRRTLMDGVIGTQERKFLDNLRQTMGISDETASSIEARLLSEAPG